MAQKKFLKIYQVTLHFCEPILIVCNKSDLLLSRTDKTKIDSDFWIEFRAECATSKKVVEKVQKKWGLGTCLKKNPNLLKIPELA